LRSPFPHWRSNPLTCLEEAGPISWPPGLFTNGETFAGRINKTKAKFNSFGENAQVDEIAIVSYGLKEIFLFREPFSLLLSKYVSSNNFADETAIAS
jgi:hypothetical protein